jgi:chromosomal replication initiator protein
MKGLTDRLLSRFKSGLSVDVQQPNYETRVAILMDKAEQNGVEIPFDAIEFMARHLKNNIRELESTIIRLLAHASLTNQEIDFGLIKKVVKERLGNKPLNEITVEDITNRVADITKLSTSELVGPSRRKPIAEARQVAIYLCREILNTSLVSIGLHFGGRDHSTVIHACNKVEKMVSEEDRMRSLVGELKKEFSFGVN